MVRMMNALKAAAATSTTKLTSRCSSGRYHPPPTATILATPVVWTNNHKQSRTFSSSTAGQQPEQGQQDQQDGNGSHEADYSGGLSWTGLGFFGSLCAGTLALGVWQTQRYFEKIQLVQQRQAGLQQPPQSLQEFLRDQTTTTTTSTTTTITTKPIGNEKEEKPEQVVVFQLQNNKNNTNNNPEITKETTSSSSLPSSPSFRRIELQGHYEYDAECLLGPRGPPAGAFPNKPGYASGGMTRSPLGYFVVTPLRLTMNHHHTKSKNGEDISNSATNTSTSTWRNLFFFWTNNDNNNNKDKDRIQHDGAIFNKDEKNNPTDLTPPLFVWVNRGWVPMNMVHPPNARTLSSSSLSSQQKHQQQEQPPSRLMDWERPPGPVSVTCVVSAPEQPKFMAPDHKLHGNNNNNNNNDNNNNNRPDRPELFWMDLTFLNCYYQYMVQEGQRSIQNNRPKKKNDNTTVASTCRSEILVTAVQPSKTADHDNDKDTDTTTATTARQPQKQTRKQTQTRQEPDQYSFPLAPPVESVGDFKTSPETHAGYAFTWYGLALAGLYMTRMMLVRK